MQKIPTVFKRDPDNMARVLPEVTPGCEWVLRGDGVATRKYDGTCMLLVDPEDVLYEISDWWARREVKPGRDAPDGFVAVQRDDVTGKVVGWEPVAQSGFAKWHNQALANNRHQVFYSGTYELCGPKVNGNPERLPEHRLIAHAEAEVAPEGSCTFNFDNLASLVTHLGSLGWEGLVWHHPTDGRMAKLKARDFPA